MFIKWLFVNLLVSVISPSLFLSGKREAVVLGQNDDLPPKIAMSKMLESVNVTFHGKIGIMDGIQIKNLKMER